jgi:class 3 adenylate cyclase
MSAHLTLEGGGTVFSRADVAFNCIYLERPSTKPQSLQFTPSCLLSSSAIPRSWIYREWRGGVQVGEFLIITRLNALKKNNLYTQGFGKLGALAESRYGWILRFTPIVGTTLIVIGLVLRSPIWLGALALVTLFGALLPGGMLTDLIFNFGVRQLFRAPSLPPTPAPRRYCYLLAGTFLAVTALFFYSGLWVLGLLLGGLVVVGGTLLSTTLWCFGSWYYSLFFSSEAVAFNLNEFGFNVQGNPANNRSLQTHSLPSAISSQNKSDRIGTPEILSQPLARPVSAFLSLPLRFKITIPYLVVAILLAGLATWVITQSFVTSLEERFNIQLVDGFETASTELFRSESTAIITERAIARTAGIAEAAIAKDTGSLNTLIGPLAINAHAPLVHVLDNSGTLIYGLRLTKDGNLLNESADFAAWPSVIKVLAGESDELGDKFSGVMNGPGGPALYVAGPLILNNQRVGVVLVGFPLSTLLPLMVADSAANVTLYKPDGQAAFSTLQKQTPMPKLTTEILTMVNTAGSHALQNRIWTVNANDYNEAVGPLLVRGQPSGWAVGVALPRSLITSSARVSPSQLAVAFALAVLAVIALGVVIAKIIAIPVFELVAASTRVAKGDLKANVREQSQDELGLLSRQFNQMVTKLRQREFMSDLFGRMVSEEVREALLLGDQLQLRGELKVVSVLFTDIRQFTNYSESHNPQEVVDMLNTYFGIVNNAVREAGGMINKFGGDSTMAIFGAPISLEPGETAHRAISAALAIRLGITESSARRVQAGLEPINIGIGINTGEVITGNVGAEERFEYTVIGDAVNVAARVQSLASEFTDSNIFITEGTYEVLAERERLLVADHGAVSLKGRRKSVHIYSVIGIQLAKTLSNTPPERPAKINEVSDRNVLETVYLYCRGFDPATIATTKNLSLESVQTWISEATTRFEQIKQELRLEFNLTDLELRRLYDVSQHQEPVTQELDSFSIPL